MERREDIPLLLRHFLNMFSQRFAKKIRGIDREALAVLRDYAYPGNVRELQNIMERAVALAEGEEADPGGPAPGLAGTGRQAAPTNGPPWRSKRRPTSTRSCRPPNTNWAESARILALPRTTLWRKMKKYGLSRS